MQELLGYSVYTTDGEVGIVEDFIIEDTLWGVHRAVIALKQPVLRSVLLSPESIRSISWSGKAVWVNHSLQELEMNPDFDPEAAVNKDESGLYDYHGRPRTSRWGARSRDVDPLFNPSRSAVRKMRNFQ